MSRITPLPYEVKAAQDGLHICIPDKVIENNYIFTAFIDNLILGASEGLGSRKVTSFDELSVNMEWSSSGSKMTTPLGKNIKSLNFAATFQKP